MAIDSTARLVDVLREQQLLSAAQLSELMRHPGRAPRDLARQLQQRGWLTAYQVNQLFQAATPLVRLGPYVLLDRLGEGGAGQVYKARHTAMQRLVAVKVIRPDLLTDAEVVGRFSREVQLVSQLEHPNVVRALDAGPMGGGHVLVMEYVEGIDLDHLVAKQGPLPIDQACAYVRQAALGLQHIHDKGLVHRDIKPSNLLLAKSQTGPGVIKILDLGLARLYAPTGSHTIHNLTLLGGAGVMQGTPDFMAPEQALDFHSADIRADIYSLGGTLYFLLTGQPPYPGSLTEKLLKHQQAPPPLAEAVRPEVPARLSTVVQKMMAKRLPDRFQTPAEVAAALAPFAQETTPTSAPARRPRRRAVVALAAVVFLLTGLGTYWLTTGKSDGDPDRSSPGGGRSNRVLAARPGETWSNQWQSITGPLHKTEKPGYGGFTGFVVDQNNGDLYVAGSDLGVFRSTDLGKSWNRVGQQLAGRTLSPGCMMFDPVRGTDTLLVAWIYGSSPTVLPRGGDTWQVMGRGGYHAEWCAVDWTDPDMKFVIVNRHGGPGPLASRDGGKTFQPLALAPSSGAWVFDSRTAVVGTRLVKDRPAGLFRTTDGGQTFTPCGDYSVRGLPRYRDGTLYWIVEGALLRTRDQGQTWQEVSKVGYGSSGPVFGASAQHMFLYVGLGIIESTDGGVTWSKPILVPSGAQSNPAAVTIDYDPVHDLLYVMLMSADVRRMTRQPR